MNSKERYSVYLDKQLVEEVKLTIGWCGFTSFSELVEVQLRKYLDSKEVKTKMED
jgi:metal-responsive CopG/Arc/MetJ family transcriptional regulator